MYLEKIHTEIMWNESEDGKFRKTAKGPEEPYDPRYPIVFARFPARAITRIYRTRPDGTYGSSDLIMEENRGYSLELVLALATGANGQLPKYPLEKAIIYASHICERCENALAFQYGLPWGYPEGADQWIKAGTSCPACEDKSND